MSEPPEEALEQILWALCIQSTCLPDTSVLACTSVSTRFHTTLQAVQFKPWIHRLTCKRIKQSDTAPRLDTLKFHDGDHHQQLPGQERVLLSQLRRQDLQLDLQEEIAEPGQPGRIQPRMNSIAFMHQSQFHVVGGGRHDYNWNEAQGQWQEAFSTDSAVFRFDQLTGCWEQLPCTGDVPTAHTHYTASASLPGYLLIWLGGYYRLSYACCFVLSLENLHWSQVELTTGGQPCITQPRFAPASCVVEQMVYAFGGRHWEDHDTETYFNDLLTLNTSRILCAGQMKAEVDRVPTSGEAPDAKFAASLTNIHNMQLLLFGGAQWKTGGGAVPDAKLHVLDLQTRCWTLVQHAGHIPRPRLQHQAKLIGSGSLMLVMGGYDGCTKEYLPAKDWAVLNLSNLQWVVGAHHDPTDPLGEPKPVINNNDPARFDEEASDWSSGSSWLCGALPCKRAGMAVAATAWSGVTEATVFGGAQYVDAYWYRDLYELRFGSLDESDAPPLAAGVEVVIEGLVAKPELNGLTGTIIQFMQDKGRYAVQTEHGVVSIRSCNVRSANAQSAQIE